MAWDKPTLVLTVIATGHAVMGIGSWYWIYFWCKGPTCFLPPQILGLDVIVIGLAPLAFGFALSLRISARSRLSSADPSVVPWMRSAGFSDVLALLGIPSVLVALTFVAAAGRALAVDQSASVLFCAGVATILLGCVQVWWAEDVEETAARRYESEPRPSFSPLIASMLRAQLDRGEIAESTPDHVPVLMSPGRPSLTRLWPHIRLALGVVFFGVSVMGLGIALAAMIHQVMATP